MGWLKINSLMGRKSKSNAMQRLANQFTDGELKSLADMINKTFQSISNRLPKVFQLISIFSVIPAEYVVPLIDVMKLMVIPLMKALGPDYIRNWMFIDVSGYLAGPLCSIFDIYIYTM